MIFTDITQFIESLVQSLFNQYSLFAYLAIFLIIFVETGLVFIPFLPGDSLLFLVGTIISSKSILELFLLFLVLSLAAIAGDSLNYFIGKWIGKAIVKRRMVKQEYLSRTEDFYKEHGAKTIFLARFIPIIRSFAPFIAGLGKMDYAKFLAYNIIGGIVWVALFLSAGYFFGNIPLIKNNLSEVILLIIVLSLIPVLVEWIKSKRES